MFINEVCKKCKLTKKAVEYYIEQGLITPSARENGYRDFSETDIVRLKKISVLRGLGLSIADIQGVLADPNASLNQISHQKNLEISIMQEKQKLIQELAKTQDWEKVQDKLLRLQRKQSVLERLRNAFPGYYGNYICQHFAPYLGEAVRTQEQQEAFDTIIAFLDGVHFEIPDDLREYYDEITADFNDRILDNVSAGMRSAILDIEKYIDENREVIESSMVYKKTAEYKSSQAYRMEEVLKQFNSTSGYSDIFIPAMCRLSKSYREYYETLQIANEKFLQRYPELGGAAGNERT
ncbi:MAG: MerR family transcriptional regulator [Lachnospiraceae bacterium]|nr:MerR family transcriptional regulator [Lachnospiraceae bacterium]MDE7205367.1 MerR family transcriptional regulator [Lachnospiraceae bacterium]